MIIGSTGISVLSSTVNGSGPSNLVPETTCISDDVPAPVEAVPMASAAPASSPDAAAVNDAAQGSQEQKKRARQSPHPLVATPDVSEIIVIDEKVPR